MKRQHKIKIKFHYKLLILFAAVFLAPAVVYGFMVAANLEASFMQNARESNRVKMEETEAGIIEFRDDLRKMADDVASDEYLCSLIDKSEEDFDRAIDYINSAELIFTKLSTSMVSNEVVNSVYLYHPSGELHYVNYTDTVDRTYFPDGEEWFARASKDGESFFMPEHKDLQSAAKSTEMCSYVAPVPTKAGRGEYAVMKINFSAEEFEKKISVGDVKSTQAAITDGNGNIVAQKGNLGGDAQEAVKRFLATGKESFSIGATRYMAESVAMDDVGFRIVFITNETLLTRDATNYRAMIMMFTGVMAVVICMMAYMIAALISRPVKSMAQMTEAIKHGVPGREYNLPPMRTNFLMRDEYAGFTDALNGLIHQVNVSNEIRNKQEFEILQMQINPHFIYNTLNTVKWSAKLEGNKRTEEAVTALINLLKSTIRVGQMYITVEEEITQIRDYITVQSYRYDDGFDVRLNADEKALGYRTLKFLLQPIVENAIFHGLDMNDKGALLSIDVSLSGGNIVYTVSDNGCGMSRDQVDELFKAGRERTGMMGIGVTNVNERIKKYFGQQYGLTVKSAEGRGTTVIMVIPAVEDFNENTDS